MTPCEGNALMYEVTRGHRRASEILFVVFDENPDACMDMIHAILRKKRFGPAWVRVFDQNPNPVKFIRAL